MPTHLGDDSSACQGYLLYPLPSFLSKEPIRDARGEGSVDLSYL
jgi:hypothetical protein